MELNFLMETRIGIGIEISELTPALKNSAKSHRERPFYHVYLTDGSTTAGYRYTAGIKVDGHLGLTYS